MKVKTLFPTFLVEHTWPDSATLNRELKKVILRYNQQEKGIVRSNAGGYHSQTDLAVWEFPCIKDLRQRVISMLPTTLMAHGCTKEQVGHFKLAGLGMWAMVNRDKEWGERHSHPGCLFSGVYYVDDGNPSKRYEMNGWMEMEDPRIGANMMSGMGGLRFYGRTLVAPRPGYMCIFPSWLPHHVRPYFGRGTRISVAFNINLEYQAQIAGRRDLSGKQTALPLQPPEAGQKVVDLVKKRKAS